MTGNREYGRKLEVAKQYVESNMKERPRIGLILGSGLGVLAEEIEEPTIIPYEKIPHFPISTVPGHSGRWVMGRLCGKQVVAMQGRFHFYEGYSLQDVTLPVRLMSGLGVRKLIVTNAAGGINTDFKPGDLMLIKDHINMMFQNPLIGPNVEEWGPRFPDMSEAYASSMREFALRTAADLGMQLQEGVYIGLTGPSYETPAEIRMLRMLGGDAVGMSTVPEVIAARHSGLEVLGISCISNYAAGILPQPLSHEEVMETTEKVKAKFLSLVKGIVEKMG